MENEKNDGHVAVEKRYNRLVVEKRRMIVGREKNDNREGEK